MLLPEQPKRGGTSRKWGGGTEIDYTFAHKNIFYGYKLCAILTILYLCLKKNVLGGQRFLACFASGPYDRLKNLSAAVNATRSAIRILPRGRGLEPKVNFFCTKIV